MASLAEYFSNNRYKSVYEFGTRVFGRWNGVPFVGSIGSDTIRDMDQGPILTVTTDLPLLYEGKIHNVLIVRHADVTTLKPLEEIGNGSKLTKPSHRTPEAEAPRTGKTVKNTPQRPTRTRSKKAKTGTEG